MDHLVLLLDLFHLEIGHRIVESGFEALAIGQRGIESRHVDLARILLPNGFALTKRVDARVIGAGRRYTVIDAGWRKHCGS
jgi:hypothetical protein